MAKTALQAAEPQTMSVNVNIDTEDMRLKRKFEATQGLPDFETVEVMAEETFRTRKFPPECMENKHPEYAFVKVPRPRSEGTTKQYDSYIAKGWRPCNSMTPVDGFWKETKLHPNLGVVLVDGDVLMVTWRKHRDKIVQRELDIANNALNAAKAEGLKEQKSFAAGQPHYAVDMEGNVTDYSASSGGDAGE